MHIEHAACFWFATDSYSQMLSLGGVFQFGTLRCLTLTFLGGQTTEIQLFLMQFDIRLEVAAIYKTVLVHNSW